MITDVFRDVMVEDIKGHVSELIKNPKSLNQMGDKLESNHGIPKSVTLSMVNGGMVNVTLETIELALICEQIAYRTGYNYYWLDKYYSKMEILNIRKYKRKEKKKDEKLNKSKDGIFFNKQFKESFINSYEEGNIRRDQALGFFRKTKEFEYKLNKDIYDMSNLEINELLLSIGYKNFNSASRDIYIMNSYMKWAIDKQISSNTKFEPISQSRSVIDMYVYRKLNIVYTKDEIMNALKQDNDMHCLIGMLIFEGVGAVNFEELQTLTVNDLSYINGKCYVKLRRGDIEIPKKLHDELIIYDKILADVNMRHAFVKSKFIFKPFDRKGSNDQLVIQDSIRNRILKNLKECLNDSSANIATIRKAGYNYYAYEYIRQSDYELTINVFRMISDRYNFNKNEIGYYYGKMLDELHLDFIKDNYGDFTVADKVLKLM